MADPVLSQQTISQTSIPDYAKPYVEDLLGKAQYFTDTEQNPYQQYQGDRVAQFSPLQQQSYTNAGLMQTAPQLQDATAMAGLAGLGALNTGYTYNPFQTKSFTSPQMAESYMSPYMQNVVERQQQNAQRQADIAAQAQGAQAARSGAFGGSGDYLMRAQAAGNLARQKGDIQAQGLQNAYQQAMAQFNQEQAATQAAANLNAQQGQFGAGLGLQGLQTALTSANALGNLGNTQYQQNMGILGMQNQYGLQQQQQVQNILNNQYQDYLNYQNYPYKQMGFMSDILRGLPLTQQASAVYQAPPSMGSSLVGLGTTALGAALKAKGGKIEEVEDVEYRDKPAGLADLALSKMG
jgi:hypothetical protein